MITLIGSNPLESEAKKIEDKNNNHGDESTWELECKFKNNLITKSLVSNIQKKDKYLFWAKRYDNLDDNSKYPLRFIRIVNLQNPLNLKEKYIN